MWEAIFSYCSYTKYITSLAYRPLNGLYAEHLIALTFVPFVLSEVLIILVLLAPMDWGKVNNWLENSY